MRTNRTDLTMTLQGICEKEHDVAIIDESNEHIEAIMTFAFRNRTEDSHNLDVLCLGGFSIKYYSEILQHMMQCIGRADFMKALILAELEGRFGESEDCGGGGLILHTSMNSQEIPDHSHNILPAQAGIMRP